MAFALTSFFADGQKFSGPGPYRGTQTYVFVCTGTTADVDFDLGDYSGTFWTAAIADTTLINGGATKGELATAVLARLQQLDGNILATARVYVPELADRIQVGTASGTDYELSLNSTSFLPEFVFDTNEGETSYTVFVEFLLTTNTQPVNESYNIQV